MTASQLNGALADPSVDTIELLAGTYAPGVIHVGANRSTQVVIRPKTAGTVVWKGGSAADAFEFGYEGRVAGHITVQGIIFDGFHLGSIGVINVGNAHDITLNDIVVRNSSGIGDHSWALYLSTDSGNGPRNVVADRWTVDGGGRTLGALQLYHSPNVKGFTAVGWKVTDTIYAIYANSDATGIGIDSWTISNSGDAAGTSGLAVVMASVSGVIKNCKMSSSGGVSIGSSMTQSSNSWN